MVITMVDLPAMSEETERRLAEEIVKMGKKCRLDGLCHPYPAEMDILTFKGAPPRGPQVRVVTMSDSALAERVRVQEAVEMSAPPDSWGLHTVQDVAVS
jgi:hypothetical protein